MEQGRKLQLEEKPHHLTNEEEAFGMLRKAAKNVPLSRALGRRMQEGPSGLAPLSLLLLELLQFLKQCFKCFIILEL